MNTVLNANFLYAQIDEDIDVLMIGFADDEFDPQEYILLQKTLNPSEEDVVAGFDEVHLMYNDESQSLYGGISQFYLTPNRVEITLKENAAEVLHSSPVIVIHYDQENIDMSEFHNYLLQMFSNEQEIYSYDF
ncbi:Imm10 family immunity protein [Paenibacillus sp. SAF-054]|uniref:Imm10 family immunity protein n=1 Tax=unclassified Paenibacillus TaxID=185978 RepID=UPI003F7D676C